MWATDSCLCVTVSISFFFFTLLVVKHRTDIFRFGWMKIKETYFHKLIFVLDIQIQNTDVYETLISIRHYRRRHVNEMVILHTDTNIAVDILG